MSSQGSVNDEVMPDAAILDRDSAAHSTDGHEGDITATRGHDEGKTGAIAAQNSRLTDLFDDDDDDEFPSSAPPKHQPSSPAAIMPFPA